MDNKEVIYYYFPQVIFSIISDHFNVNYDVHYYIAFKNSCTLLYIVRYLLSKAHLGRKEYFALCDHPRNSTGLSHRSLLKPIIDYTTKYQISYVIIQ